MAGKGDTYRPVDAQRYRAGWERTFLKGFGWAGEVDLTRPQDLPSPLREAVENMDLGPVSADDYVFFASDAQPVRLPGDRHG